MNEQNKQHSKKRFVLFLWQRLPVIVRAILTGALVAAIGTLPWAYFVALNIKYWSSIPWALVPAVAYLWLFWNYFKGAWWPKSTSHIRRISIRANNLSGDVWGAAILAGILGLVTVVLFSNVYGRMVRLPAQNIDDISLVPLATLFSWLIMSAIVAGITEEAAFRGYMQKPIEQRHGPLLAILLTGTMFGFVHFTHPEVTFSLMPFYMLAAAVYGLLAYLTNSILPGIVLHAGGNIFTSFGLLTTGQSEWQTPKAPLPLIWETGADSSFWIACILLLFIAGLSVWAYIALATMVRKSK